MSPWTVYWITRLDVLDVFLDALVFVSILGFAGTILVWVMHENERIQNIAFRWIPFAAIVFVCCIFLNGLAPTTKEIVAIYALPKIVNNEKVQQIPENAMDLINEQMKAWIEDLRGKKGEKK